MHIFGKLWEPLHGVVLSSGLSQRDGISAFDISTEELGLRPDKGLSTLYPVFNTMIVVFRGLAEF